MTFYIRIARDSRARESKEEDSKEGAEEKKVLIGFGQFCELDPLNSAPLRWSLQRQLDHSGDGKESSIRSWPKLTVWFFGLHDVFGRSSGNSTPWQPGTLAFGDISTLKIDEHINLWKVNQPHPIKRPRVR